MAERVLSAGLRGRGARGLLVALAAGLVAYAVNVVFYEVRPGNAWGLVYGSLAAALMVLATAYGLRRRSMRLVTRLGAGSASRWLGLHVYGGLLFLLLMLMHSGFTLPSGWVTWSLWLLSFWTVLGGIAGLALQRWIPPQLASGLSVEVHYDRIPEMVDEVRERARAVADAGDEPLRRLYDTVVAPQMAAPHRSLVYLRDATGGVRSRLQEFAYLRKFLSAEESERLDELEALFRTKLEIDCHYTLQAVLRGWLVLHAPASMLLLGLLALHVISVLLY